jgi:hypothetical protein
VNDKENDETLLKVYHFDFDNNEDVEIYSERIRALQKLVKDGKIGQASYWNAGQMVTICFATSWLPLGRLWSEWANYKNAHIGIRGRLAKYSLCAILKRSTNHHLSNKLSASAVSLYPLRNVDTKAKGLGFALAGNFYLDFFLWLGDDETS